MLLDVEVGELEVGNIAVIIPVVSEDVLHHVDDFVLVFLHDPLKRFRNLFLTELFVLVCVIRNDELEDSGSDLFGEGVVVEGESVDGFCVQWWLWFF